MEAATIYAPARGRITALVGSLSDVELDTQVPACPLWSVRDTVAHLSGAASDLVTGNLAGAPGDGWTAKQVADRRGRALSDVVAEWSINAATIEADLTMPQLAFDIVTHEWDIRGAVGRPGDRHDHDLDTVVQEVVGFLDGRIKKAGLAPLRIRSGTDEWQLGGGEPAITLSIEAYELFRLAFGRRSAGQVRGYDWDGDPTPYLPVLSFFPYAEHDLSEP